MALPEFDYIAAKSYEEASKLMASMGSECVVMSGGTDVILQIPKFVSRGMKTVIDLKSVPEQTRLEFVEGEGLYVGANTKLFDIQSSPVVLDKMPAVAQAAHYVGSNQVRRKGTMVGSICNASPTGRLWLDPAGNERKSQDLQCGKRHPRGRNGRFLARLQEDRRR